MSDAPAAPAAPASPAPAAPAPPATPPAEKPWYDGVQDAEIKTWVAAKNYPSVEAALTGHRSLEKLLGSDQRLILPKDPTDKAAWDKVWNTLGRPDSPDKYTFQAPEDVKVDKDLADGFAKVAHETGITQAQAKSLFDWKLSEDQRMVTELLARSEADINALRVEWGAAFDQKVEAGKRAAREFGLSEEFLHSLEGAPNVPPLTTAQLLRFFAEIGAKLGEHPIEGKSSGAFTMTPAQAKMEISRLRGDPTFLVRYQNDDPNVRKSAIEEMARLHKLAEGEAA